MSCPVPGISKGKAGASPLLPSPPSSSAAPSPAYNAKANDLSFGQERQPGQRARLSTQREVSTIPNVDVFPEHQLVPGEEKKERWVYPSEQQYFNAIKKKGYDYEEAVIPTVLAIHNHVNEVGWGQVREWESLRGCHTPKLKYFVGRPGDFTPKAYFLNSVYGRTLPFDRHDWIIDRDGKEVRYVLEFYNGRRVDGKPISMHLDVRPAIDSPAALVDIASRLYRDHVRPFFRR